MSSSSRSSSKERKKTPEKKVVPKRLDDLEKIIEYEYNPLKEKLERIKDLFKKLNTIYERVDRQGEDRVHIIWDELDRVRESYERAFDYKIFKDPANPNVWYNYKLHTLVQKNEFANIYNELKDLLKREIDNDNEDAMEEAIPIDLYNDIFNEILADMYQSAIEEQNRINMELEDVASKIEEYKTLRKDYMKKTVKLNKDIKSLIAEFVGKHGINYKYPVKIPGTKKKVGGKIRKTKKNKTISR